MVAGSPTVGGLGGYLRNGIRTAPAKIAAWRASRVLKGRGMSQPERHVAVGLGFAVFVTLLFVSLPANVNPEDFPAGLLWSFRISSLGTQLVLWTGLGVIFGALCERARRKGAA